MKKNRLNVGQRIGVFEIVGDTPEREIHSGGVLWQVKCLLCGNVKKLKYEKIFIYKSCGCKRADNQSLALRKSLNRGGCGDIYASHWNVVKKNAKQRDLPFEITVQYAWELFLKQKGRCALSGLPLQFSTRCWSHNATASLDRIDSNKGYVIGNVQWIHKMVNFMKQEFDQKDFVDMCGKIWYHSRQLTP